MKRNPCLSISLTNMIRTLKYKIDYTETYRKFRRYCDGLSYRRYFIILLFIAVMLLYLGPSILRLLIFKSEIPIQGKYII